MQKCALCGEESPSLSQPTRLTKETELAIKLGGIPSVRLCHHCFIREHSRSSAEELSEDLWDQLQIIGNLEDEIHEISDRAEDFRNDAERMYGHIKYLESKQ
jgi:hypothetical protein